MCIQIPNSFNGPVQRALTSLKAINGLDYGAYGRLIQHCTDLDLPRQAKQLHSRLVLFSVTPDNFLGSKLITFYSRSNHIFQARKVFDKIPNKNVFSWNAMLIGYTLQNMYTETLRLFSSLVSSYSVQLRPDNYTMTCALKAMSCLVGDSRLAKEVHGFVLRHGFDLDVFVLNALIAYCSKCDDTAVARRLFDGINEKDIVTWNSMIAGYSQNGFYEECKELYKEMLNSSGFRPNGVTVVSLLQACGQSKDLILGMEIHRFIVENQVEIDISVCNAIVGLYAKCGSLDYARELFQEMSEKDDVTYGSIISGYLVNGFVDQAMDLFQEIESPGLTAWNALISGLAQNNEHEGILNLVREMQTRGHKPNSVTLSSILPTLSYFSNLKGGKQIHGFAVRNKCDNNIYVSTALIDAYAKSGFLHGARRVFDQSKNKSLVIWTAIISAYAAHGDANLARNLFDEMLNNGIQPDSITFTSVLAAYAHSGIVDEAWEVFNAMRSRYGIQPSVEQYACMAGVLSRAGRLYEAAEFISKMPIEPSAKVWGALLNGASVFGDVELGKFVCNRLLEIEPENTGTYTIMTNLYSQAGRWDEADKVRDRMRKIGLKKIPGASWIESAQGLQSFIAKDTSNERTEEISMMLGGLLELMREEGYVLQDEFDEEIDCG